jgi:hypothetical protein
MRYGIIDLVTWGLPGRGRLRTHDAGLCHDDLAGSLRLYGKARGASGARDPLRSTTAIRFSSTKLRSSGSTSRGANHSFTRHISGSFRDLCEVVQASILIAARSRFVKSSLRSGICRSDGKGSKSKPAADNLVPIGSTHATRLVIQ